MKMQITFKSGAQVVIECDEFELRPGPSYRWVTKDGQYPKMVDVDPKEVVCIVRLSHK